MRNKGLGCEAAEAGHTHASMTKTTRRIGFTSLVSTMVVAVSCLINVNNALQTSFNTSVIQIDIADLVNLNGNISISGTDPSINEVRLVRSDQSSSLPSSVNALFNCFSEGGSGTQPNRPIELSDLTLTFDDSLNFTSDDDVFSVFSISSDECSLELTNVIVSQINTDLDQDSLFDRQSQFGSSMPELKSLVSVSDDALFQGTDVHFSEVYLLSEGSSIISVTDGAIADLDGLSLWAVSTTSNDTSSEGGTILTARRNATVGIRRFSFSDVTGEGNTSAVYEFERAAFEITSQSVFSVECGTGNNDDPITQEKSGSAFVLADESPKNVSIKKCRFDSSWQSSIIDITLESDNLDDGSQQAAVILSDLSVASGATSAIETGLVIRGVTHMDSVRITEVTLGSHSLALYMDGLLYDSSLPADSDVLRNYFEAISESELNEGMESGILMTDLSFNGDSSFSKLILMDMDSQNTRINDDDLLVGGGSMDCMIRPLIRISGLSFTECGECKSAIYAGLLPQSSVSDNDFGSNARVTVEDLLVSEFTATNAVFLGTVDSSSVYRFQSDSSLSYNSVTQLELVPLYAMVSSEVIVSGKNAVMRGSVASVSLVRSSDGSTGMMNVSAPLFAVSDGSIAKEGYDSIRDALAMNGSFVESTAWVIRALVEADIFGSLVIEEFGYTVSEYLDFSDNGTMLDWTGPSEFWMDVGTSQLSNYSYYGFGSQTAAAAVNDDDDSNEQGSVKVYFAALNGGSVVLQEGSLDMDGVFLDSQAMLMSDETRNDSAIVLSKNARSVVFDAMDVSGMMLQLMDADRSDLVFGSSSANNMEVSSLTPWMIVRNSTLRCDSDLTQSQRPCGVGTLYTDLFAGDAGMDNVQILFENSQLLNAPIKVRPGVVDGSLIDTSMGGVIGSLSSLNYAESSVYQSALSVRYGSLFDSYSSSNDGYYFQFVIRECNLTGVVDYPSLDVTDGHLYYFTADHSDISLTDEAIPGLFIPLVMVHNSVMHVRIESDENEQDSYLSRVFSYHLRTPVISSDLSELNMTNDTTDSELGITELSELVIELRQSLLSDNVMMPDSSLSISASRIDFGNSGSANVSAASLIFVNEEYVQWDDDDGEQNDLMLAGVQSKIELFTLMNDFQSKPVFRVFGSTNTFPLVTVSNSGDDLTLNAPLISHEFENDFPRITLYLQGYLLANKVSFNNDMNPLISSTMSSSSMNEDNSEYYCTVDSSSQDIRGNVMMDSLYLNQTMTNQGLIYTECVNVIFSEISLSDSTYNLDSNVSSNSSMSFITIVNGNLTVDHSNFTALSTIYSTLVFVIDERKLMLQMDEDMPVYQLIFTDSSFDGCTSQSMADGPALFVERIFNDTIDFEPVTLVSVSIEDGTFANNKAGESDGNGGGVYAESIDILNITRSVFENNDAANGGGLFALNVGNLMISDETQFKENSVTQFGGGMFINSPRTCQVSSNNDDNIEEQMHSVKLEKVSVEDSQGIMGSGVFIQCSKLEMIECNLNRNTGLKNQRLEEIDTERCQRGAGLFANRICLIQLDSVGMSSNKAEYGAGMALSGLINSENSICNNIIKGSTFSSNEAFVVGGGVHIVPNYINGANTVDGADIDDDTAIQFDLRWYNDSESSSLGWVLKFESLSSFSDNRAAKRGGAIAISYEWFSDDEDINADNRADELSPDTFEIQFNNVSFQRNTLSVSLTDDDDDTTESDIGGAALAWFVNDNSRATMSVSECTFTSNSHADSQGSAVYVSCWNCRSTRMSYFKHFHSHHLSDSSEHVCAHCQANEHKTLASSLTVTDSEFDSNSAFFGGAMSVQCVGSLTFNGVTMESNSAASTHGGALWSFGVSQVNVQGSQFMENSAAQRGGAMVLSCANETTVSNSDFDKNEADTNGGALFITDIATDIMIEECNFTDNLAGISGGALAWFTTGFAWEILGNNNNDGSVTSMMSVTDSDFKFNSALIGGAVYSGSYADIISFLGDSITNNSNEMDVSQVNTRNLVKSFSYEFVFSDDTRTDHESYGQGFNVTRVMLLYEPKPGGTSNNVEQPIWQSTYRWRDSGDGQMFDAESHSLGDTDPYTSLPLLQFLQPSHVVSIEDETTGDVLEQRYDNALRMNNDMYLRFRVDGSELTAAMVEQEHNGRSVEFGFDFELHGFIHDGLLHGQKLEDFDNSKADDYSKMDLKINTLFKDCMFERNTARSMGGAIVIDDPYTIYDDVSIDHCSFIHNDATVAGALAVSSNHWRLYSDADNSPSNYYDDMVNEDWDLVTRRNYRILTNVSQCQFDHNTADTAGAVLIQQSNLDLSLTDFTHNHANNTGGALYMHSGVLRMQDGIVNVQSNEAGTDGGGMYTQFTMIDSRSTLNDSSNAVLFENNRAMSGKGGAAMHIAELSPLILNFTNEEDYSVVSNLTETMNGGVGPSKFDLVYLSGVQFDHNVANQSGGAVYIDSNFDPYALCHGFVCPSVTNDDDESNSETNQRRRMAALKNALEMSSPANYLGSRMSQNARPGFLSQVSSFLGGKMINTASFVSGFFDGGYGQTKRRLLSLSDLMMTNMPSDHHRGWSIKPDRKLIERAMMIEKTMENDNHSPSLMNHHRKLLSQVFGMDQTTEQPNEDDNNMFEDQSTTDSPEQGTTEDPLTNCLRLKITVDDHESDIRWMISSEDTDFTLMGDYSELSNLVGDEGCIYVNETDECFDVSVYDSFGDGLNHGEGDWSISLESLVYESQTSGDFSFSENITICRESVIFTNDDETYDNFRTVMLMLDISAKRSLEFLLAFEHDLKPAFEHRLKTELIFGNIFEGKVGRTEADACIRDFQYCGNVGQDAVFTTLALQCLWNVSDSGTRKFNDTNGQSKELSDFDWAKLFLIDDDDYTDEQSRNYAEDILDEYCESFLPSDWNNDGTGSKDIEVNGLQESSEFYDENFEEAPITLSLPTFFFLRQGDGFKDGSTDDDVYEYDNGDSNANGGTDWDSLWIDGDLTVCQFYSKNEVMNQLCSAVFDYSGGDIKPVRQLPLICQVGSCDNKGCDADSVSIIYSSESERFSEKGVQSYAYESSNLVSSALSYEIIDLRFEILGTYTMNFCFDGDSLDELDAFMRGTQLSSSTTMMPSDLDDEDDSMNDTTSTMEPETTNTAYESNVTRFFGKGAFVYTSYDCETLDLLLEWLQDYAHSRAVILGLNVGKDSVINTPSPLTPTPTEENEVIAETVYEYSVNLEFIAYGMDYDDQFVPHQSEILHIFESDLEADDVEDSSDIQALKMTIEGEPMDINVTKMTLVSEKSNSTIFYDTVNPIMFREMYTLGTSESLIDEGYMFEFFDREEELLSNLTLVSNSIVRSARTGAPTSSPTVSPTPAPTAYDFHLPVRVVKGSSGAEFGRTVWQMKNLTYEEEQPATDAPTLRPTTSPTMNGTEGTTDAPTMAVPPTIAPSTLTMSPTMSPTVAPTLSPRNDLVISFACETRQPTRAPTVSPTIQADTDERAVGEDQESDFVALFGYDSSAIPDLESNEFGDPEESLEWVAPLTKYVSNTDEFAGINEACGLSVSRNFDPLIYYVAFAQLWNPATYGCTNFRTSVLQLIDNERGLMMSRNDNVTSLSDLEWQSLRVSDQSDDDCADLSSPLTQLSALKYHESHQSSIGAVCIYIDTQSEEGDCEEAGDECRIAVKRVFNSLPSVMTIAQSSFSENVAYSGNGGSIAVVSGDVEFQDPITSSVDPVRVGDYLSVKVMDSTITDSRAQNGNGGAIYKSSITDIPDLDSEEGSEFSTLVSAKSTLLSNLGSLMELHNVSLSGNQAVNGGAMYAKATPDLSYIWKSMISIVNSEFDENNSTDNGGSLYLTWLSSEVSRSRFANGHCNEFGGAIYIVNAAMFIDESEFESNIAENSGGGLYKPFDQTDEFLKSICFALYRSSFIMNEAKSNLGGGVYLELYGDEHTGDLGFGEQSCATMFRNSFSDNRALRGGDDVYIGVTDGLHDLANPDSSSPLGWACGNDQTDPGNCVIKSALRYMCIQFYDVTQDYECDQVSQTLNDSSYRGYDYSRLTNGTQADLNPGTSQLLEVLGWDVFGNRLNVTEPDPDSDDAEATRNVWTISLSATGKTTVTDTIESSTKDSWLLPIFINAATEGETATIVVEDDNNVANSLNYSITIIECSPGFHQTALDFGDGFENDEDLFKCQPCFAGTYTMNTTSCKQCIDGLTCGGGNDVNVSYLWYAIEADYDEYDDYLTLNYTELYSNETIRQAKIDDDFGRYDNNTGSLATSICPVGYCCANTEGCNLNNYPQNWDEEQDGYNSRLDTSYSKPCAEGRNPYVPLCGSCWDELSETSSAVGVCAKCPSNVGLLPTFGLPGIVGFGVVAFWFKKGMLVKQDIPAAAIVYFSRTMVFFFQLLPYLTFQSPIPALAPLSAVFSLNIELPSGAGACILKNMSTLEKIYMEATPSMVLFFQLGIISLLMTRTKAFHDDPQAKNNLLRAMSVTAWQIIILVYAKIAGVSIKLIDCRPLGLEYKSRMGYAGEYKCYTRLHAGPFVLFASVTLFPFFIIYVLKRINDRPHTRELPGGWRGLRELQPALVLPFRRSSWWYPAWGVFRKFLVVGTASLPFDSPDITATYLCMAVAFILGFHVFVQPYYHHLNNQLESMVLFVAFSLALFNVPSDPPTFYRAVALVIAVAPFIPVGLMIFHFIYEKQPFALELHDPKDTDKAKGHGLKKVFNLPQSKFLPVWYGKQLFIIHRAERHEDEYMARIQDGDTEDYRKEWDENDSRSWHRSLSKSDSNESFSHFERLVTREAKRHGKLFVTLKDQGIDFRALRDQHRDIPGLGDGEIIPYQSETEESGEINLESSESSDSTSWHQHLEGRRRTGTKDSDDSNKTDSHSSSDFFIEGYTTKKPAKVTAAPSRRKLDLTAAANSSGGTFRAASLRSKGGVTPVETGSTPVGVPGLSNASSGGNMSSRFMNTIATVRTKSFAPSSVFAGPSSGKTQSARTLPGNLNETGEDIVSPLATDATPALLSMGAPASPIPDAFLDAKPAFMGGRDQLSTGIEMAPMGSILPDEYGLTSAMSIDLETSMDERKDSMFPDVGGDDENSEEKKQASGALLMTVPGQSSGKDGKKHGKQPSLSLDFPALDPAGGMSDSVAGARRASGFHLPENRKSKIIKAVESFEGRGMTVKNPTVKRAMHSMVAAVLDTMYSEAVIASLNEDDDGFVNEEDWDAVDLDDWEVPELSYSMHDTDSDEAVARDRGLERAGGFGIDASATVKDETTVDDNKDDTNSEVSSFAGNIYELSSTFRRQLQMLEDGLRYDHDSEDERGIHPERLKALTPQIGATTGPREGLVDLQPALLQMASQDSVESDDESGQSLTPPVTEQAGASSSAVVRHSSIAERPKSGAPTTIVVEMVETDPKRPSYLTNPSNNHLGSPLVAESDAEYYTTDDDYDSDDSAPNPSPSAKDHPPNDSSAAVISADPKKEAEKQIEMQDLSGAEEKDEPQSVKPKPFDPPSTAESAAESETKEEISQPTEEPESEAPQPESVETQKTDETAVKEEEDAKDEPLVAEDEDVSADPKSSEDQKEVESITKEEETSLDDESVEDDKGTPDPPVMAPRGSNSAGLSASSALIPPDPASPMAEDSISMDLAAYMASDSEGEN